MTRWEAPGGGSSLQTQEYGPSTAFCMYVSGPLLWAYVSGLLLYVRVFMQKGPCVCQLSDSHIWKEVEFIYSKNKFVHLAVISVSYESS